MPDLDIVFPVLPDGPIGHQILGRKFRIWRDHNTDGCDIQLVLPAPASAGGFPARFRTKINLDFPWMSFKIFGSDQ